jgi:hypothetical protein
VRHREPMENVRNAYRILVEKPERKITPRRPRSRWKDNIKMDIEERGFEVMVRIQKV